METNLPSPICLGQTATLLEGNWLSQTTCDWERHLVGESQCQVQDGAPQLCERWFTNLLWYDGIVVEWMVSVFLKPVESVVLSTVPSGKRIYLWNTFFHGKTHHKQVMCNSYV